MFRVTLVLAGALLAALGTPAHAQTKRQVSLAHDPQNYRTDAAQHVYATYADRIYKGMLPPLVHAIVVVETEVDGAGNVQSVRAVRSPSHAPDATEAVLAMIRNASPFPARGDHGSMKFVEVWLVDRSGRFQLHTLTEGQL
ncbi:MAG TPA: energy transducer TonB [Burkholderiaceae bacterium]|nr:energy transducer TonB [Burkholderiaceae bacterium]